MSQISDFMSQAGLTIPMILSADNEEDVCPFCGNLGVCPHLLLVVDTTFRSAEGGALMEAFSERWHGLCEEGGEDFDEAEPFDDLLDEVHALADAAVYQDHDGGPGMSSARVIFYVKTERKARAAVRKFSRHTVRSDGGGLDSGTVRAYLETEYRVRDEPHLALLVGEPNVTLRSLHERHGVTCSAFVTACNPFSKALDDAANAKRQVALAVEITRMGLPYLDGVGQHPSNGWPGEESYLVLGLELEDAKRLCTQFEQNGFVWSGPDAVPQLILLR